MGPQERDPERSPSPVERLFAAWLERCASGAEPDLSDLCRAQPELAAEVDRLIERFAREGSAALATLSQRLEQRFGSDVDPKIELSGEPRGGDAPSDVMGRLAQRGPVSARYRVRDEVAQGGMGAVLRVWDEDLRRHLAMKVMLAGAQRAGAPTPTDARALARFLEEAQVTGQLDHPGIVPVHELGLDEQGRVFFTMKLVRGQTLKQVFDALSRGEDGWTTARVLGLLLKVCEATRYAHDKGVIHRDLKPANVMVGRYGEVYVMDWGLARVLDRPDARDIRLRDESIGHTGPVRTERAERAGETPDSPLCTMDGDVIGTPAYMPPEQAHGRLEALGPRADVYAMGAMLYHLLAGHMPYVRAGDSASNYAVWRWVREGPPTPLGDECPDAPAELVAICERAMQRDPAARYADMTALAADLSAFLEGRVVEAFESGALAEARKWVRRNRSLAAALASVVLAIALGGVAFAFKAREATRAAVSAGVSAQEAREQRDVALAEREKVLRLSDARVLEQLGSQADKLWPPHPDRIDDFESWIGRARALCERLPLHEETLARLQDAASEVDPAELAAALEEHPLAAARRARQAERDALSSTLPRPITPMQRAWLERRIAQLDAHLGLLSDAMDAQCRWRFASNEDQWQHSLLVDLVSDLRTLRAGLLAEDEVAPPQGWSVPRRLTYARELQRDFAPGGRWARAWEQALPQLRADLPDLDLSPQMGLVPLGPDPDSGRWEFANLVTGEPPQRDASGHLQIGEQSGVVLVLFDRDGFRMGAQSGDPGGPNHDGQAIDVEGPVHEVELSPFFLSKYELTQGQWIRLTGDNPSQYRENWQPAGGKRVTWLHPVEQVSWLDLTTWLPRAGLRLPSEAQWEYAARGGTDTPWWTGEVRESLAELHAANLADRSAERGGASWMAMADWPEFDDGFIVHAPVGTYAANPFGLHEVTGNVWELCQDGYDGSYYAKAPPVDPLCDGTQRMFRVARGGSYDFSYVLARSAARGNYTPTVFNASIGARPGRAVDP
jgi:serine/threonine-protein kinase